MNIETIGLTVSFLFALYAIYDGASNLMQDNY